MPSWNLMMTGMQRMPFMGWTGLSWMEAESQWSSRERKAGEILIGEGTGIEAETGIGIETKNAFNVEAEVTGMIFFLLLLPILLLLLLLQRKGWKEQRTGQGRKRINGDMGKGTKKESKRRREEGEGREEEDMK